MISLAGIASLVGVCLAIPGGRAFLAIVAVAFAVITFALLSCLSGHAAAALVNFVRLEFGRAGLELNLQRDRQHRFAGR